MSERGPTTELPHDFYGRIVKLEVQTHPQKLWAIGLLLMGLSIVFGLFGMTAMDGGRGFLVAICGVVLFPFGLFMIYGAIQITGMPTMYVKLGLETLRYPRGRFLWRSHEEVVKLLRIPHVGLFTQNGQMFLRLTHPDASTQTIQQAWMPEGWSVMDLYILLQMRIRGARQQLDRTQQVGAEALAFAEADVVGVVVNTRGKRPKAYAFIYDLEDYETLLAEDGFPHADHRLVIASGKTETLSGAVAAHVISSLDAELELELEKG